MSAPTPEKIKAFLDDLARISLKHGLVVGSNYEGAAVQLPDSDFDGYSCDTYWDGERRGSNLYSRRFDVPHMRDDHHNSIDLAQLSNHERLMIMGERV